VKEQSDAPRFSGISTTRFEIAWRPCGASARRRCEQNVQGVERRPRRIVSGCAIEGTGLAAARRADEHLDAESVAWLERYLHDFPAPFIAARTLGILLKRRRLDPRARTAATAFRKRAIHVVGSSRPLALSVEE